MAHEDVSSRFLFDQGLGACLTTVFCQTGKFKVNNVSPQANGDSSKVKVKVRINGNGIFSVAGATMYEKVEGEEEKEESMDVDGDEEKKDGSTPVSNGTPEEVSRFNFFFFLTFLLSQWPFFPWEIWLAFPEESQLQQPKRQCYVTKVTCYRPPYRGTGWLNW